LVGKYFTSAERLTVLRLIQIIQRMTAEKIGFAMEKLFELGALDVYTTPIGMKKCRPGTMLSVICTEDNREVLVEALFKYTTTLGIREEKVMRYTLKRETNIIKTKYGEIREKISEGYSVKKSKLEFDDLKDIANQNGLSIDEVEKLASSGKMM